MNEARAMAETESKEFRVRYSKWMHGILIVEFFVYIVFVFMPIIFLGAIRREMTIGTPPVEISLPTDPWRQLVLMLLGWSLCFLLVALGIGYWEIRYRLEQKRGRAVVDGQNLTLTDWRGRVKEIALSDIRELRVYSTSFTSSSMAVKAHDKWTNFSRYLVKNNELAEILITRCRLQLVRDNWIAASYAREG